MTEQKPIKKKHLIIILLGFIAIILLWRGIWEVSAKLFSAEVSLILGIVILIVIAAIEKRPIYKFFGWK